MIAKIYFAKVRPDAIIPTKRQEDACYDLWTNEEVILPPQIPIPVDTGIATAFDSDWVAVIKERS